MTEADLQAGLRSLRASLRQIKSLMAWEQLKQAEAKPGQPPAFQVYDPTETELRNEFSFFLATMTEVQGILNGGGISIQEEDYRNAKRQLLRLEQELNATNLHHRFWRP